MLFLLLYSYRRHCRAFITHLLAFSLIWSPVMQARAAFPLALIPIGVIAARAFMAAAVRLGPLLTHTNIGMGVGIGSLGYLVDKNWEEVVGYTVNAASSAHAAVSAGVLSFAALAGSVGVTAVSTDVSSYTWSSSAGTLYISYGKVDLKDALPGNPGDAAFNYSLRRDGKFLYLPLAGSSYSTVYNSSGFKTYLCPLMPNPSSEPTQEACRSLPEMSFGANQYGTQYMSIGIGCNEPMDCAKAYVSGRLVQLSGLQGLYSDQQGQRNFANAVNNVSANFGSCFDSRSSGYASFPGYRCPVTLQYDIARLESQTPDSYTPVTENYAIDVNLNMPLLTQTQSLNDYLDRYPLAGNEPVSPASIAAIVNGMFTRAVSRPGYAGLNYFPITAADVAGSLQAGERVPLSSLVLPIEGVPPGTIPGNPTVPPGTGTVDLGPNPAIPAPVLEGIPTAAQIMAPIFDLFPSLQNFQVPGHTSQCPAFVVPLWGQNVSTTKHCELLESQRAPLGAAALVGWSIAALIIVLGA